MPLADYADNASPKPPFGLQEAPLSNILVTGAAGLLGGEICALLVAGGHRVTALVHTNRDIRANDGAPVPVAEIVAGDVSLERFGWDAAQFDAIAAAHELLLRASAAAAHVSSHVPSASSLPSQQSQTPSPTRDAGIRRSSAHAKCFVVVKPEHAEVRGSSAPSAQSQ